MFRKRTILLLVVALMTTFLAPARFALACSLPSPSTHCPMMVRAAQQNAPWAACCAEKQTVVPATTTSLTPPCCCKVKPASSLPSVPERTELASENVAFVLTTTVLGRSAPLMQTLTLASVSLEVTAPRGPPLPFTGLRAPPFFS